MNTPTHPHVWNCPLIEAIPTRLAVLKRFMPVKNRRGMCEQFLVLVCWSSNHADTHGFSVAYSMN